MKYMNINLQNYTKTSMRPRSGPSPEGTKLMFAGGAVSPIMCPVDGQQRDAKNGQTVDKPRCGQRQCQE